MRAFVVFVVLIAAAIGGWFAYQHWFALSDEMVYETAVISKGSVVSSVSATGKVEPLVKVIVGTQVSGTITKWYADFNDEVTEGFVLAEIDKERFLAAIDQKEASEAVARARVKEAEARYELAQLDRQRIERAYKQNVASDLEMKTRIAEEKAALASLEATKAQLQAAEADLKQARIDLDKTIIRSPIDGVVISRDIDEGQTVAASFQSPDLFTIANNLEQMRVNAAVGEADIGVVCEGMPVEFQVDAFPGRRFSGVVSQVRYAENINNQVVTYTTLINVDNEDFSLRPGMTAIINFEVQRCDGAMIVPNAALRFDPTFVEQESEQWQPPKVGRQAQPRVFKLVDDALVEVPVTIGLTNGRVTAVTADGLTEGDEVVIAQTAVKTRKAKKS